MSTATALAIAILALSCTDASGQAGSADAPSRSIGQQFGVLSANAVVGGLTGAVRALLTGTDISSAASRGMLGGAVIYLGKTVASDDWDGAGFTGRTVAGFGSGLVHGATDSAPLLEQLELTIGPIRFRPVPPAGAARFRLNIFEAVVLARALGEAGMRMDWSRSLGAGTPVFITRRTQLLNDGESVNGLTTNGFIVLQDRSPDDMDQTFRHEMIHVVQIDFFQRAWGDPIEEHLRQANSWTQRIPSWLQVGIVVPGLFSGFDLFLDDDQGLRGLMQEEAEWFERR